MEVKHHHKKRSDAKSDQQRFYWQMPNRVLKAIGIKEGMKVADFGSGNGYFAQRIAKRVGKDGKVYAIDSDEAELAQLRKLINKEAIENMKILHGREIAEKVPKAEIDVVLMVNVVHLLEDFDRLVPAEIFPILKPEGQIVIVQWDAEKMDPELEDWGENNRKLYTLRATLRKIYDAGCEVIKMAHFLPMQTIYYCQPKEAQ